MANVNTMNKVEYTANFCAELERQRVALNLSQADMANKLDMSLVSYKRLILGDVTKIELFNILKLYELTGLLLCEFVDYSADPRMDTIRKLKGLTTEELALVNSFVDYLRINGNNYLLDFCKVFVKAIK